MADLTHLSPETVAVVAGRPARAIGAPVSPGIELTSTYVDSDVMVTGNIPYGRDRNATWVDLEATVGALEGAPTGAVAYASGMAAGAAVHSLMPRGTRLVMGVTSYNAMVAVAKDRAARGEIDLTLVDVADTEAVLGALPHADWLLLETLTNPLLDVADLPALCAAARTAGVMVAVDGTFTTPLLQNPLAVGADLVLHSATKYLAGHSDLLLGIVVTRDPNLLTRLRRHRTLAGGIPGAFEAWLTLRGLRTLPVRFERQQRTAGILGERLARHPAVSRVRYPGLASDPGHDVATRTLRGYGAMLSVELRDGPQADAFVRRTRLWVPATSFGGVESLLERRRRIPSEPDSVPESLVRLSVGLEDADDLWRDLEQALDG